MAYFFISHKWVYCTYGAVFENASLAENNAVVDFTSYEDILGV